MKWVFKYVQTYMSSMDRNLFCWFKMLKLLSCNYKNCDERCNCFTQSTLYWHLRMLQKQNGGNQAATDDFLHNRDGSYVNPCEDIEDLSKIKVLLITPVSNSLSKVCWLVKHSAKHLASGRIVTNSTCSTT